MRRSSIIFVFVKLDNFYFSSKILIYIFRVSIKQNFMTFTAEIDELR